MSTFTTHFELKTDLGLGPELLRLGPGCADSRVNACIASSSSTPSPRHAICSHTINKHYCYRAHCFAATVHRAR